MQPLTAGEIDWISTHINDDPLKLRLKYHADHRATELITQIECRRKASAKLSDTLACKEFIFPSGLAAEQSTSDRLAAEHASMIDAGSTLLDMTCGLGIDVFHCAAKASSVTAIELNPDTCDAARINSRVLGHDNIELINADSIEWLRDNANRHFDYIFIDPARRGDNGRRLYALSDCNPDVIASLEMLTSRCTTLIIKASPMLDVTAVMREIGHPCDVIVLGTQRECKELVIRVPGSGTVEAVTLGDNRRNSFAFQPAEEAGMTVETGMPTPGQYLLEPYPSMMKAGGFNTLANRLKIHKLNHNSHLYFDDRIPGQFPGRAYRIIESQPFGKSSMKALAARHKAMSVTTRNFPMQAAELSKKMKLKESATKSLFATNGPDGPVLIVAERIG